MAAGDMQRLASQSLLNRTFYDLTLLERALPNLVHAMAGQKGRQVLVPQGYGGTVDFRAFAALPAATTPLAEGVTPTATDVTVTHVTATPLPYGAHIQFTDIISTQAIDPVLTEFAEMLGEQAGNTIDILTRDVLVATTNIVRPNSRATTGAVTSSDKISASVILQAKRALDHANARPFANGNYLGIISAYTEYDMLQDSTIHNVLKDIYDTGKGNPLVQGYVGTCFGIDWYRTSNAYVNAGAGSGSIDVHTTLILGRNAYGVGGYAAMMPGAISASQREPGTGQRIRPVRLMTVPAGTPTKDDPLGQRGTIGWKTSHVAVILNNAFMVGIEHAVSA